ncbi:MAG: twin-arginine translocation signal domain-containing protein, partial [Pseudomonadota bacterium]
MINRRNFLTGMTAAGLAASVTPVNAAGITTSGGRLNPGSPDDQGPVLQALLDKAAKQNTILVLDPGRYRVSNITLPKNTRILGVSGSTVLEYAGGDHFIYGENGSYTELSGIVFDGALQPVKEYADAALRINGTSHLKMSDCRITNAGQIGVQIDKSAGTFERNRIDNAV